MSNKQKLKELEATVKNALAEIEKLKNGSGFDWDFTKTDYTADVDGEFWNNNDCDDRYRIKYANHFKTNQYCIQSARANAWNSLLFKLAEHFNPEGWEWVVGEKYKLITFNQEILELEDFPYWQRDYMTAKFHPDVIDDVIEELNNNKSKWWHIVTDEELVE